MECFRDGSVCFLARVYVQSISIKQARKKRGGAKDVFSCTSESASEEWGDVAKGAEGEPEAYFFFRYFLCCLCLWTRMVPENSVNYLSYLFMWGNIPPSGIFEAVQKVFF